MANENQGKLHKVDWSTLPRPEDDGGTHHLVGFPLPSILLPSTHGRDVDLSSLSGTVVIFIYPMTGRPDVALPEGWDMIPGARGCTPQACAFRDTHLDLLAAGADHVFGLSTQSTDYQNEAAERLHLPFPLLSDETGGWHKSLGLPTMEVEAMTLLRRLTLILRDGKIEKTFYPVFPPDRSAQDVLDWLNPN